VWPEQKQLEMESRNPKRGRFEMDAVRLLVIIATADLVPFASQIIRISRELYVDLVDEGPHIIHNFLADFLKMNNTMEDNQEILSIDEIK
jgi:hypothetical protein